MNTISLKPIKILVCWMVLSLVSSSCATPSQITLENRTLRILPDLSGFYYQQKVCTKYILFKCWKKEWKRDVYLFEDKHSIQKLKDMGFVLKVRVKP